MLMPLDGFSPAPDSSSLHVLDVFRQARFSPQPKLKELMRTQLQSAFDACKLPVKDRVSLARVFELAEGHVLDISSLPVVAALCHAWLHRTRSTLSPAECVEPVAAALNELLPAPITGALQTWGIRPHQSSSGWMSTWRVWRTVATALNMSGILSPPPANHVTCTYSPSSFCFSNRMQGCEFGDFSPSNLAFASMPLPRSCAPGEPWFLSLLEPRPQKLPALPSPFKVKQEDGMQHNDVVPVEPAASVDAELDGSESLASLLAACPPSWHSGMLDSVCRYVLFPASSCICLRLKRWRVITGTSSRVSWRLSFTGSVFQDLIRRTRLRCDLQPRPPSLSPSLPCRRLCISSASQMLFLVIHSFIFRRLAGTLALM